MRKMELWFKRNRSTNGFNNKKEEIRFRLWKYMGSVLFSTILDPFNFIRISLLKLFGAKIGSNVYIGRHVNIVHPWFLKIGHNSGLDDFTYINGNVEIGSNVSIASYAKLISAGHDVRSRYFTWTVKKLTISDGAFIGSSSVILGGVKVGVFSVIGANSFVIKDIPDNVIAVGNPCKSFKERIPIEDFTRYSFSHE